MNTVKMCRNHELQVQFHSGKPGPELTILPFSPSKKKKKKKKKEKKKKGIGESAWLIKDIVELIHLSPK